MKKIDLINRNIHGKLYVQLCELLKNRIESGEWLLDTRIPTEEDLCKTYEVSKATVRLAVSELVRQGYLTRQQGKGTFVRNKINSGNVMMSTRSTEFMLEEGVKFSTQVLAQTVMMPVDDISAKLNTPEDEHIIYIKRLCTVDKEPVLLQEAYVPYHVCPYLLAEDITGNSLLDLFEKKFGLPITKLKDFIEVVTCKVVECNLLKLPEGSPALLLDQHFYSGDTQIMYMRSIKRPDRSRFTIEFEKK